MGCRLAGVLVAAVSASTFALSEQLQRGKRVSTEGVSPSSGEIMAKVGRAGAGAISGAGGRLGGDVVFATRHGEAVNTIPLILSFSPREKGRSFSVLRDAVAQRVVVMFANEDLVTSSSYFTTERRV